MDKTDIPKANALYQQWQMLTAAQEALAKDNPRIVGFSLASDRGPPIGVPAEGMTYPAQMVESIRHAVEQRVKAVADELSSMGFTTG